MLNQRNADMMMNKLQSPALYFFKKFGNEIFLSYAHFEMMDFMQVIHGFITKSYLDSIQPQTTQYKKLCKNILLKNTELLEMA